MIPYNEYLSLALCLPASCSLEDVSTLASAMGTLMVYIDKKELIITRVLYIVQYSFSENNKRLA